MSFELKYAVHSHPGCIRKENQDAWFALPEHGLFGVSDGMGGQSAGQLASRIVAETLPGFLKKHLGQRPNLLKPETPTCIASAVAELSAAMNEESSNRPELRGMGATVVVTVIQNDAAIFAHLGDSRAYLFRGGRMQQLTEDHNLAATLVRVGDAQESRHQDLSGKSQLIRYVGRREETQADVGELIPLRNTDRILMCTDGLTNMLSDEQLQKILSKVDDPQKACREMVEGANSAGGRDNITALLVTVSDGS